MGIPVELRRLARLDVDHILMIATARPTDVAELIVDSVTDPGASPAG